MIPRLAVYYGDDLEVVALRRRVLGSGLRHPCDLSIDAIPSARPENRLQVLALIRFTCMRGFRLHRPLERHTAEDG